MSNYSVKKTILIFLILFSTSCSTDVLDIAPTTELVTEQFWKTKEHVDLALNGVYSKLAEVENNFVYLDCLTDNALSNNAHEGWKSIALGTFGPNVGGAVNKYWVGCHSGVGRANYFLDNFKSVLGLTEDYKNSVEGQALFLRSYFYFRLTDFFGGVPLVLESPKIEHGKLPRNTKIEVVDQIIKDLTTAAEKLPATQTEVGRITKWAAKALLARVQLFNNKYEDAATTAKDIMDNGGFVLFPNYRELFLKENENNTEIIFDIQYKEPEQGNNFQTYVGGLESMGWSAVVPVNSLVNIYQMKNGKSIDDPTSGYDPTKPYDNRDPRLKQTLFVPGSVVNGFTFVDESGNPSKSNAHTDFTFKKYTEYDEDPKKIVEVIATAIHSHNAIVIRLAEVMLTYAEAQNEFLPAPDASVYKAVNDVRARVEMPPLPTGLNKDNMRVAIRQERRVEFVLEGLRYSDIRRWDIGVETLNNFIDVGGKRKFESPKNNLWPIPGYEFDIDGHQLKQNPGY